MCGCDNHAWVRAGTLRMRSTRRTDALRAATRGGATEGVLLGNDA